MSDQYRPTTIPERAVVVIPMHNEASVIVQVVAAACAHFRTVICVDDGSTDASAKLAAAQGARVIRHARNLGQGAALETGIRSALAIPSCDYVVTFDADGQHDIDEAVSMVEAARRLDVQVLLGSRFIGDHVDMPTSRRLVLRLATAFTRCTTRLAVTDAHNGLRVLRRDAAEGIRLQLPGMSHASEILSIVARKGFTYAEHPVTVAYTEYSRSKGQRGWNAMNILYDLAVMNLRSTP